MPKKPAWTRLTSPPKPSTKFSATAAIANTTTRVKSRIRKGSSSACASGGTSASSRISASGGPQRRAWSARARGGTPSAGPASAMDREQPLRAPGEDGGHEHEDHHAAERRRQEHAPEGVGDADHERRDERAADRADAADHGHDEGEDEDRLAHADLHREDRPGHDAGKSGKRGARRRTWS